MTGVYDRYVTAEQAELDKAAPLSDDDKKDPAKMEFAWPRLITIATSALSGWPRNSDNPLPLGEGAATLI